MSAYRMARGCRSLGEIRIIAARLFCNLGSGGSIQVGWVVVEVGRLPQKINTRKFLLKTQALFYPFFSEASNLRG